MGSSVCFEMNLNSILTYNCPKATFDYDWSCLWIWWILVILVFGVCHKHWHIIGVGVCNKHWHNFWWFGVCHNHWHIIGLSLKIKIFVLVDYWIYDCWRDLQIVNCLSNIYLHVILLEWFLVFGVCGYSYQLHKLTGLSL